MRKQLGLFLCLLGACGGDGGDPLKDLDDTPESRPAPECAAGPVSLFAETAGDLGRPAAIVEDGEIAAVFAGSNQFEHALFFVRMDKHGEPKILERLRIPGTAPFSHPAITRSGNSFSSGFGIAWEDRRNAENAFDTEIYFARLDEEGLVLGNEVRVSTTSSASSPALAFAGDGYGLVWADTVEDTSPRCKEKQECFHALYFVKLTPTGILVGEPVRLTDPAQDAVDPSLLWTGGGYLLAYNDTSKDSSPECAADKAACTYGVTVAALDRDGRVQRSETLAGVMDPQLIKAVDDPDAFLVGWAEGIFLARVSPSGEVRELGRSVVPVEGIPHFSLTISREGLWLALSDSPAGEKPEDIFANDIRVYRLSSEGVLMEKEGFPVSFSQSRSEHPFVAAVEGGALVLWREARETTFPACKERPQGCVADLAVAKVSCGEGVTPLPEAPEFAPMIPESLGEGWGGLFGNPSKPKTSSEASLPPTPFPF